MSSKRRHARITLACGLTALGVSAGCRGSDAVTPIAFCAAPRSISVSVAVNDSVSGASIADATLGVAQSVSHTDSLVFTSPPPLLSGGTMLGTFIVILDHAGYAQWRRDGVLVTQQGLCGNVVPVQLIARMRPLP